MIAFSGATHDVATDGVYMSELEQAGPGQVYRLAGSLYNIAKIVASGGWSAGRRLAGPGFGGVEGAMRQSATRLPGMHG